MEPEIIPEVQSVQETTVVDAPQGNKEPEQTPPTAPSQVEAPKPEQKFTKRERLEFTIKKATEQLESLDNEPDDSTPLTHGDLRKMRQNDTRQTAVQLAESIADEDERAEVIEMLEGRIVPSDNAQSDLLLAKGMVNARKNAQLLEEQARKGKPGSHVNTPSAPGYTEGVFTPTAEEIIFMSPPYNLSKDEIIAQRNKATE